MSLQRSSKVFNYTMSVHHKKIVCPAAAATAMVAAAVAAAMKADSEREPEVRRLGLHVCR